MAFKSSTFVIRCGSLNPTARQRCKDWLWQYTNEHVSELPNGDVYVDWTAYKAGREALATRVGSINLGISIALTQHVQEVIP